MIISEIIGRDKYILAGIAMGAVFQAAARTKTLRDLAHALLVRIISRILHGKRMRRMMMVFLVIHETIHAQSEVIAIFAHDICHHIGYRKCTTTRKNTFKTIVTNAAGILAIDVFFHDGQVSGVDEICRLGSRFVLLDTSQATT